MKVYPIMVAATALALAGCQNQPAADPAANGGEFDLNASPIAEDIAPDANMTAAASDPAQDETAIRGVLDRIYTPYAQANAPERSTAGLYTADLAEALQSRADQVEIDPFLGARTYQAFEPRVGALAIRGDTANVAVTYTQQIRPRTRERPPVIETRRIQLTFRRASSDWGANRGWQVAEVASSASPSLRQAVGLRPLP